MEIRNAIYKTVPVRNLTFPLAAGTVVTAGGTLANSDGSDAYGIVPETVALLPLTKRLYVAVAGTIDLMSAAYDGITFTDAMIKALGKDFNFVPAKEIADPAPELPPVTSTDNGKVLTVVDGEWSAASASGGGLQIIAVTRSNTGVLSCGKSYNELCAYIEGGKSLLFSFDFDNEASGYGTLDQLYYSASSEEYCLAVYLDSTYYLTASSADAELRFVMD